MKKSTQKKWLIDEQRAFAFLDSLQQELDIYSRLVTKSEQQQRYIEKRDENALVQLIVEKEQDIQALQKIHEAFAQERSILDSTDMGSFSCIDEEIDKVLQATEMTLKQLVENETRDMNALKVFQDQHVDRMDQLKKGEKMAKAYFSKGQGKKMDRSV